MSQFYTPGSGGGGGGDVNGPASSTDNAVVRFDGTSGKTIQSSAATLSDAGDLTLNDAILTNTEGFALPGGTTGERPGTPVEGDLRKNTTTNAAEYYDGSSWVDLTAGGGATTFSDAAFRVYDNGDNTKNIALEASGITTLTTRTITMADQDIDLTPTTGDFQASDADLTAISALSGSGVVTRTGTSTWATNTIADRAIVAGDAGNTVQGIGPLSDGELVIGATGADPAAASLTAPAAGITITGGANSVTFALADDLAAVEGLSSTGMAARTASDTWTTRTITGTSNEVDVTNGDGVSGNPTLALSDTVDLSGHTSFAVPSSAAPTVNSDGEIANDTTVTDWSHGILKYYGGEEMGVVAMPIAQFTSPTDDYVVTYNATNDEFELQPGGGGSSPLTTKGDLYTYDTGDARLPVGSNNLPLVADSAQSTGLKYAVLTEPGGGTNQSTYTVNDILYADATDSLAKLGGPTNMSQVVGVTGLDSAAPALEWKGMAEARAVSYFHSDLNVNRNISGTGTDIEEGVRAGSTGIIFNTGTTASGVANIRFTSDNESYWLDTSNVLRMECMAWLEQLSNATDEYVWQWGFHKRWQFGTAQTDGIYFLYDRATDGANWRCVTRASATASNSDSSVAVAADTLIHLAIEVNSAKDEVKFYINGTLVATNGSNIPTASTFDFPLTAFQLNTAGTGSGRKSMFGINRIWYDNS